MPADLADGHLVVAGKCYVAWPCSCPEGSHWTICAEHQPPVEVKDAKQQAPIPEAPARTESPDPRSP